jgi:sialate O-acetylesterase
MKLKRVVAFALLASAAVAQAEVKPARLFSDNMVIQRETNAPFWGWAESGEEVTVSGSWGAAASTTADERGKWIVKLNTPKAGGPFEITFKGSNTIKCKNVLAGDVWLCSGQSNMEMNVGLCKNAEEEMANADFPQLRHFKVGRNPTRIPAEDCTGSWEICSPETVSHFSGTAYFTGRELHKVLHIPIGLINSSWGGTSVEAWTAFEVQKHDPVVTDQLKVYDSTAPLYDEKRAKKYHEQMLKAWREAVKKAEEANEEIPNPPKFIVHPHKNENYPGNLYRGMIHPLVPYAIKGAIWYQGERNSKRKIFAEHYRVQLPRMIKYWRKVWDQEMPFFFVQLPNYRAPQVNPVESEDTWPVTRDSFMHVLHHTPNTGMVATIDIGEEDDIHPKNKQDVGIRMASTILNKTYGKATPTCPIFRSHAIDGNKVIITFDFTGSGLMVKGEALKTFVVAGADQRFVWADAVIKDDKVIVSSDRVKKPIAVRYAWADNPIGCNLYSKEGFPAAPFRTDRWDLLE